MSGCTATQTRTQTNHASLAKLEKSSAARTAVSGQLLVTAELEGRSVTVPAVLLAEWPDRFRLELQDPVGGLLALVVVNGESFWLYQSEAKEILTGPLRKLPFAMLPKGSAEDLVRVFLARPYVERLRRGELSEGKGVIALKELHETVTWDDSGDPTFWKRQPAGQHASAAFYEDFEFKNGVRYPVKIRLVGRGLDKKSHEATLVWKDWEPSVPTEKKLFQIPQQQTFGRKIKALP